MATVTLARNRSRDDSSNEQDHQGDGEHSEKSVNRSDDDVTRSHAARALDLILHFPLHHSVSHLPMRA